MPNLPWHAGPNCCFNNSRALYYAQWEPQSTSTKNLQHLAQSKSNSIENSQWMLTYQERHQWLYQRIRSRNTQKRWLKWKTSCGLTSVIKLFLLVMTCFCDSDPKWQIWKIRLRMVRKYCAVQLARHSTCVCFGKHSTVHKHFIGVRRTRCACRSQWCAKTAGWADLPGAVPRRSQLWPCRLCGGNSRQCGRLRPRHPVFAIPRIVFISHGRPNFG